MNIAIFFNLPYLTMLDSQARHLLHYYAESSGIDFKNGLNKCKPFFVQVAQGTGKIYRKYPKVKEGKKSIKIQRFNYSMPSKYLVDAYEEKKAAYLKDLIKGYEGELGGKVKETRPSDVAFDCYYRSKAGEKQQAIADDINKSQQMVCRYVGNVRRYLKSKESDGTKGGAPILQYHN